MSDKNKLITLEGLTAYNNALEEKVTQQIEAAIVGKTDYLGTVSSMGELSTTCGKGDFYRVDVEFKFGTDIAHAGDILIAIKDEPEQNISDWDLIHTEVIANYVTTDTPQKITGKKTFTNSLIVLSEITAQNNITVENFLTSRYLSVGDSNTISATKSTAIGYDNKITSGERAYSTAIGVGLRINKDGQGQVAVGTYNDPKANVVFSVGCGNAADNKKDIPERRQNGLEVYKDGTVKVWDANTNAMVKVATESQIGDINTALDNIIAMQNSLIGGNV